MLAVGPGEHVDDTGGTVGLDVEAELAEAVYDAVAIGVVLQLARELGRPFREVLDLGHVLEHLVARRVENGRDRCVLHSSITPFSARSSASRSSGASAAAISLSSSA